MDMDELKKTERYFQRIMELENYPELKRERDELKEENLRLEERVSELEGKIRDQAGEIDGLKARLEEEINRRRDAEEKLKFETRGTEELKKTMENLKKEIDSLRIYKLRFANGKELTLEQAKTEFIKIQEEEIKKRTNESFLKLKSEYEVKLPKLIHGKLIELLSKKPWPDYIEGVIGAEAKKISDEILYHPGKWPDGFKKFYINEVNEKVKNVIDSEFNARVERETSKRVVEKLAVLKREEWPRWYSENIEPRITNLESNIKENALKQLVGPWRISCEKCCTVQEVSLADHVGDLLSLGYTEVECSNPGCKDWWFRHKIKLSLHNFVLGATGTLTG
jgi:hypothetical protein